MNRSRRKIYLSFDKSQKLEIGASLYSHNIYYGKYSALTLCLPVFHFASFSGIWPLAGLKLDRFALPIPPIPEAAIFHDDRPQTDPASARPTLSPNSG